jgi:hypothetical protein
LWCAVRLMASSTTRARTSCSASRWVSFTEHELDIDCVAVLTEVLPLPFKLLTPTPPHGYILLLKPQDASV